MCPKSVFLSDKQNSGKMLGKKEFVHFDSRKCYTMDTAIACAFCAQSMYFLMTEHSTKVKENKDLSGNTSRLEVHIL